MASYLIYIIVSCVFVTLIICLCSDDDDSLFRDEIPQEIGSDIVVDDDDDDIEYSEIDDDDRRFSDNIV